MVLKLAKVALASWVLFIFASVILGGGDTFRSFSEKAGSTFQTAAEVLANKADSLKEEADAVKDRISSWTAPKKEKDGGKG